MRVVITSRSNTNTSITSVPSPAASAPWRVPDMDWGAPHPSVLHPAKRLMDIVGALVGLGITGLVLIPIRAILTFFCQPYHKIPTYLKRVLANMISFR